MKRLPWASELDEASLARRAGLPAGTRFRKIGEGWDNAAYLGPGGLLYRFSKRRGEHRFLRAEARLLRMLEGKLPIAIPRVLREGPGFMAYRPLRGTFLVDVAPTAALAKSVGAAIGRFVDALRRVPVKARGIRAEVNTPAGQRLEAIDALRQIEKRGLRYPGLRLLLDRVPPPFRGRLVLAHHDLLPEHILVRRGRPSGVIDWADAGLADPAADFVGLMMWGGRRAVDAALDVFGHPVDGGLVARMEYFALCVAVSEIRYGLLDARPKCVAEGERALSWLATSPRR